MAVSPSGETWAQIDSPIGNIESIDLARSLRLMENAVCGGLCHLFVRGEHLVTVRHCVPLESLDAKEFTDPLLMVTGSAYALKSELTG